MLPNGYIAMNGLYGGTYEYIDTGIYPKNTMSAQIAFAYARDSAGYIFGARNTNSNTSAGQFGFYLGASGGADYFCWASARISQTLPSVAQTYYNFSNEKSEGVLCANGRYVSEFSGNASTTFTGTRTIHLLGFNNAGTHTALSHTLYGFRLYDDGTLIANYAPVYEIASGKAGMYDLVSNTFISSATSNAFGIGVLIDGTSDGGGKVCFRTNEFGLVDEIRSLTGSTDYITAVAVNEEGYVFRNWEVNGTIVSTDAEYTFNPTAATTLKAVFEKTTDQIQENVYKAIALPYNEQLGTDTKRNAVYLNVLDYSIKEDAMQKSVSTLVCKEIPSSLKINVPVFLYDQKNKIIFYGAIQSINGNEISCREPIYLYDDDILVSTSDYNAHYNVLQFMSEIVNAPTDKTNSIMSLFSTVSKIVPVDSSLLQTTPMLPYDSAYVKNGEDLLIDLFKNYGIIPRYSFYKQVYGSSETWRLGIEPYNPKMYGRLYIGDNIETVTNVSITTEEADATILKIYNKSGTTLRGTYGIRYDGTIAKVESNVSQFVYKDIYKQKVVMSDDNMKSIAKENLTNSLYQHKIEFDLEVGRMISADDIKLGRDISFNYKDKIYDSIITAKSYSKGSNVMHITLGIVRTNLTSKLNLGRK